MNDSSLRGIVGEVMLRGLHNSADTAHLLQKLLACVGNSFLCWQHDLMLIISQGEIDLR